MLGKRVGLALKSARRPPLSRKQTPSGKIFPSRGPVIINDETRIVYKNKNDAYLCQ